jgi:RNA recognition motif-containing protein
MPKRLYIGNLSYNTTEAALQDLFGAVGEVTSVSIPVDRMSGRSRGFGFVEMADPEAAQQAIHQLNGRVVDGRAIKVAEAHPSKPGGQRGEYRSY